MKRISLSASLAVIALVLLAGGGCGVVEHMTTAKGTFSVAVRNESTQPIRIGLAKTGPPFEEEWSSPEDVAIMQAKHHNASWGQVVLPGQVGTIGSISGRFNDGVYAIVRVYANDPSLTDMLAIGRHSPNRLDLPLQDGVNRFVVTDDGKQLSAKRLPQQEPKAAPTGTSARSD